MSRLLVSVRSAPEAELALAAGVDLIDVKEPRRGALGQANGEVIAAVVSTVAGKRPVSAALGELLDDNQPREFAALPAVDFAKIGLAGCAHVRDWPRRWRRALGSLPPSVACVAVVYADREAAQAPAARDIVERAAEYGCRAVLVDTFDKSAGGLLSQWSLAQLDEWIAQVHALDMLAVVGGRLCIADIDRLLTAGLPTTRPDYFAVRGAACGGARDSELSTVLLAELARLFRPTARESLTN